MIHALASRPHHWRHLAPIAEALGPDFDGLKPAPRDGPVMIAGPEELNRTGRSPVVLVEHGAGQRYVGVDHRSWGGRGLDRVALYLAPRRELCDRFTERYPNADTAVVGCPALDQHRPKILGDPPVVAFGFHWQPAVKLPELRPAVAHYRDALPQIVADLRAAGCEVVGHFHPRHRALGKWWRSIGVSVEANWDLLLARLDVLVVDNSSVGFEAAAVGRSVVWLNAPWFRRGVEQGLRFWSHVGTGRQADHPVDVVGTVLDACDGPPVGAEALSGDVYGPMDHRAAERAAEAIRARFRQPG